MVSLNDLLEQQEEEERTLLDVLPRDFVTELRTGFTPRELEHMRNRPIPSADTLIESHRPFEVARHGFTPEEVSASMEAGPRALELGTRIWDVLGAGAIRNLYDIALNYGPRGEQVVSEGGAQIEYETPSFANNVARTIFAGPRVLFNTERREEWIARGVGNISAILGGTPHERESISYATNINRYVYGSDYAPEQAPFINKAIMGLGGLTGDILIDPIWFVSFIGAGSKAASVRRFNNLAEMIGLSSRERNVLGLARGMRRAGMQLSPQQFREFTAVQKGMRGIPQLETAAQEAGAGLRGIVRTLHTTTTPYETWLSRMTGGRLSLEWRARGAKQLAPYLEHLEAKHGITDMWTFWDFTRGGEASTRTIRQAIENLERIAAGELRLGQHTAEQQLQLWRKKIREVAKIIDQKPHLVEQALVDLTEIQRIGLGNIDDYINLRGYVALGEELPPGAAYQEGATIPLRRIPGAAEPDFFYHVTPEGVRMEPTAVPGREVAVPGRPTNYAELDRLAREVDPLTILESGWEHQRFRDLVTEYRKTWPGYIAAERAAGVRSAELVPGGNPIRRLTKEGQEEYVEFVTNYVHHRWSPQTRELARKMEWITGSTTNKAGFTVNDNFLQSWKQFIDPRSVTQRRRTSRLPLDAYNEHFRQKHGSAIIDNLGIDPGDFNFFETDPAKTLAARYLESRRIIVSSQFGNSLADHLSKYRQFVVAPGKKPPSGYVRLSDVFTSEKPNAKDIFFQFDMATQAKLSSVYLPANSDVLNLVKRRIAMLTNPEYVRGFEAFAKHTTNWWKANVLGIFPAYHLGNLVSNMTLLWQSGMWDPTKITLMAKIQAGAEGTVKARNGIVYKFSDLRAMMHQHQVMGTGMYGMNIDVPVGFKGLLRGYYDPNFAKLPLTQKIADAATGSLVAATGINPNIAEMLTAKGLANLLPMGGDWLPNRLGFMIGGFIEDNARGALFLHRFLNEGVAPRVAGEGVMRSLFNYTKRTKTQQRLSTWFPFYEFMWQNASFQSLQMIEHPGRTAMLYRFFNQSVPAMTGAINKGALPEWMQNRLLVKWPWADEEGRAQALDLTRFQPWAEIPGIVGALGELPEAVKERGAGVFVDLPGVLSAAGGEIASLNPFIQWYTGIARNVDPFTQRQIERYPGSKSVVRFPLGDVEMTEQIAWTMRQFFRIFNELERGDYARSLGGINLISERPGMRLYHRGIEIEKNISNRLPDLDPAFAVRGIPLPDNLREDTIRWLVEHNPDMIANYYARFASGEDQRGNPLQPFTANVARYTWGEGEQKAKYVIKDSYDLLDAAGRGLANQISYVRNDPRFTGDERVAELSKWWLAYDENVQWRVGWLMNVAQSLIDPEGVGRIDQIMPANYRERASQAVDRAIHDLDNAIGLYNTPVDLVVEYSDMYWRLQEYKLINGLAPPSVYQNNSGSDWLRGRLESLVQRHGIDLRLTIEQHELINQAWIEGLPQPIPAGGQ